MSAWLKRFVALAAIIIVSAAQPKAEEVVIFAAASLTNAMQDVGKAYEERTGNKLKYSFASSSTLAKQIEAGGPAQIFASANEKWMDYLAERKLIVEGTRVSPIGNRLVLIAPADSELKPLEVTDALDIPALLGADNRLAVGDPAHVPAGIYAKDALTKLKLWDGVEAKLARADNVRAALALVETGEAPLGIVYSTDAAASRKIRVLGAFPADSHTPVTYPFAIVKVEGEDKPEVKKVFEFLTGTESMAIYSKHGFGQNSGS